MKGAYAIRAVRVDRARDHLAAGAALAADEHAAAAGRGALHQIHHGAHRRRRADDAERHRFRRTRDRCGDAASDACSRAFAISASRSRADGGRGSTSKTPARIASAAADGRSGSAMPITTACGCLLRTARAIRIASPFCRKSTRTTEHRRFQPVHRVHAVHEERLVADSAKERAELRFLGLAGHQQGGGRDTLRCKRRGRHGVSRREDAGAGRRRPPRD